jgi:hypothetical protein
MVLSAVSRCWRLEVRVGMGPAGEAVVVVVYLRGRVKFGWRKF